jgi:hypothetical protein
MNWQATVRVPIGVVFELLGDPSRLGDWLPEVTVPAAPPGAADAGARFTLTVGDGSARLAAEGEVTACEPPWLAGYRLFIGPRTVILRVTCAARADGSQVRVRQAGDIALAVDLGRLARALGQEPGPADGRAPG